jgi:flagellar biogenesis protein FliO
MRLKNFLTILFLLSMTMVHAGSKVQSTPPPAPQQQSAPVEKQPETPPAKELPEAKPEMAPKQEMKAPGPLPSSEEVTTSYESAFVRMLVTLLGLVFLVFATFWVLRKMGRGKFKMGGGRTINVIERRAVSPKTMLYIVEIGNKKVLISESQLEVRALTTYEEIPESSE